MNPTLATKIGGVEAASWIQTLTSGDPQDLSLYIHIPFCRKKCPYCHFYSLPEKDDAKDAFLVALLQEIHIYMSLIERHRIVSIYFGGGTPSLFGPKRVEQVLSCFHDRAGAEITLEANPESLSFEDFFAYCSLGVNRLSLGVQSFCQSDLSLLSRSHSESEVRRIIEKAHEIGCRNISLDLMYDLPHQDLLSWKETLSKAFSLPITHCSAYNLVIEPNTAFARKKQELESKMPDVAHSLAMRTYLAREAEKAGFSQYEISAFCRPGFHSKHNCGYWQGRYFLGFGPSAFSFFKRRFSNKASLNEYIRCLEMNTLPIDYSDDLSPQERVAELIAVGLRMNEGVHLPTLETRFGKSSDTLRKTLEDLERVRLIEKDIDQYRLTPKGQLLYDEIASEII